MFGSIIILFVTIAIYIPLAGVLLYVWWKHGKGEVGVTIARAIFLLGSVFLFLYMLTF
jgi:TRAP-type C4-dicarboxylate transport system permease large subunit